MDNKTAEQRHINMSHIKGKDTKPEIVVRKFLFGKGFRYRKNDRKLPGHPDIVLPKYRTVVFVHGCFWHGHESCKYATLPSTHTSFWKEKIAENRMRDQKVFNELQTLGWRVITVWECELKNKNERDKKLNNLSEQIMTLQTIN